MIRRYKKLPVEIEAIQFTGDNWEFIEEWSNDRVYVRGTKLPDSDKEMEMSKLQLRAKVGDYIIRGIRGEYYPCEKIKFEEMFREVL